MTGDETRSLAWIHLENEPEYIKRLIDRIVRDDSGDNVDEVADDEDRDLDLQTQAFFSEAWSGLL